MKKVKPKVDEYMESGIAKGMPQKGKDPVKTYPKFHLTHEFFPEAVKMEVGKTYKIELEVKCVGLSISRFNNDTEFEIHGYSIDKNGKESGESTDKSEDSESENVEDED